MNFGSTISSNRGLRHGIAAFVAIAGLGASAQAAFLYYEAILTGPAEAPPNASPGIGFASVLLDTTAHTMKLHVTFSGLLGTVTASHIHGATAVAGTGTAGVATTTPTFAGFPLGVTAGVYDNTLDLTQSTSWNAAYITANGGSPASAEIAFLAAMSAGKTYLNIHTNLFPGGEIRGFLQVPSPGAAAVFGLGGLLAVRRRRA